MAVWVPPRSIGERALVSSASLLVVSDATAGGAGAARVSLEALPRVRAVTLVFDARDVTLLRVKVPPLSGARLARAIPNLVEDALLQDPQSCAFALGPSVGDGERLIAVIDKAWLEFVVGAFERRGVRVLAAWPAQLALPCVPDRWSFGIAHGGIAIRTSPTAGFGWAASSGAGTERDALVRALDAALHTAARPEGVDAYAEDRASRAAIEEAASRLELRVTFNDFAAPQPAPLDLLSARQGSAGSRWLANVDWRAWRLPAAVLAGCAAMFLLGLNLHWASLARERAALRSQAEAVFRQAFPSAQVVVDPLLQMQRQVADMRLATGRSGPGDFLPLLVRLSEALGSSGADALASVEYRDGRLRARARDGLFDGAAARENLRAACLQRGLKADFEGEGAATVLIVGPQA